MVLALDFLFVPNCCLCPYCHTHRSFETCLIEEMSGMEVDQGVWQHAVHSHLLTKASILKLIGSSAHTIWLTFEMPCIVPATMGDLLSQQHFVYQKMRSASVLDVLCLQSQPASVMFSQSLSSKRADSCPVSPIFLCFCASVACSFIKYIYLQ